ncbi:MAG TPA: phage portal protein [Terracidiphilus sp.]|nr:phage portal protein [Terracidiphilus sp.]
MNIAEAVRGAWRRVAGVSAENFSTRSRIPPYENRVGWGTRGTHAPAQNAGSVGQPVLGRRTAALPSIFNSYGSLNEAMPKPTPYNLRRFSETPIARRAINCIKDRIAGMRWRVQPRQGYAIDTIPFGAERIRILASNFESPNPDDSFRSLAEQVLEDVIVGGFGAIEVQRNPGFELHAVASPNFWQNRPEVGHPLLDDPSASLRSAGGTNGAAPARMAGGGARPTQGTPLLLWPVDGASIRINLEWDGSPSSQRYMQIVDRGGSNMQVALDDDELIYIRLNPRTHTPFGMGRLEVAFETINAFLGAHRYASRLASNTVVQYALWLQDLTPEHHERLIRWWQDEIEGTGKVPILSVESKPEVLRFGGGTDADLRLQWQEFLLRVVADAFDLPPFYLGVERDVNRSTAEEYNDLAFRQAIVPTARLFAEALTRDAIAKKLGWDDLEFAFAELDTTDPLQEAQIQQILLQNGVLTVNEVRRMRGLGPMEGTASVSGG